MTDESKLLQALIEEPTRYTIDVLDGTMLPENIKNKKTLDFVVKPPTLEILSKAAIILQEVPEEILKAESLGLKEVAPYIDLIIKVICTVSYGQKGDYPDWYEPFFKSNITPKEAFGIFQEVSIKMQSDFFLSSFQIATKLNPLMLKNPGDLTHTN
jgi:hypothetical protein